MNIEEAIEILKEFKKTGFHTLMIKYNKDRIHTNKIIEQAIETLLTAYEKEKEKNKEHKRKLIGIIEKQSKEIEEYKKQLDLDYVDKHFVPIERYNQLEKEIEELKKPKYIINCKTNEITKLTNDFVSKDKIKAKIEEIDYKMIAHQDVREAVKAVLQSLLKVKE